MRKSFSDLMSDVILEDICCYCGACGAFCENVFYENETPYAKNCFDCGMCYDVCPRTEINVESLEKKFLNGVREDETLGFYREIICARTLDEEIRGVCQDGGFTTTLLVHLLEEGIVDACIVAKSYDWNPQPFIAKSRKDILESAGSKYTQCPSLLALGKALDEGLRVAFVGLPCHIQAVRKLQDLDYAFNGEIVLTVGLFCMETFNSSKFFRYLEEIGIDLDSVRRFDIKKGKFIVEGDGRREIPIKDMKHLMRDGCRVCLDFSAELADVSVGSVGSPNGWNTVILRSEKALDVFEGIKDKVEVKNIGEKGLNALRKLAEMKKSENMKNLKASIVR